MYAMKRKESGMPRDFAEAVIDRSVSGAPAAVDASGAPYRVPLSFVRGGGRLLCQRRTPADMAAFDDAIAGGRDRTAVREVLIGGISGKRRR
jgi:hypothetical protein